MRFKTWLLAGTSLGLMAMAPVPSYAQDAELRTAYQAYVDAQASGDAAALEAAQGALTELCIVNGFASLEECMAALAAPPPEQPAPEQPAVEAPVEQPVPVDPAAEEVTPVPEPAPEPAPEPEPVPQPEPAPEPAPEPTPAPAPVEEPAPVMEEPAPQPVPEPAPVEQPAPEPAPTPVEEAPAPQQMEAPAVVEPSAPVDPAAPAAATVDISAELAAEVDAYNGAIADLMAGADPADSQARLDAARTRIAELCASAGFADTTSCLAQYGLELPPVPVLDTPVAPAPTDATAPVPEQPPVVEETTVSGAPAEPVEDLPEGVTAEQIAPVLDSAKDVDVVPAGEVAPEAQAQPTEPAAPPPATDVEAQSEEIRTLAVEPMAASVTADQGTAVTATENTTVNQTVVNNYVTNITNNVTNVTNNVTDNSTNVTQNNIGQQNNVTVVEAPTVQTSTGDVIAQVILQVGNQLIVNSVGQDTDRFYDPQQDEIYYENLSNGRVREVITRPDGTQIVTVRNRNGDVLRRSRITPDGREYVLAYFDDRYGEQLDTWYDPGRDLPPLRLNIPVRDYVLDARYADEDELETFFAQPPVEQVARIYSIDEVKRSARIRDSVRKLEVGNLTFDTGAATIGRDQVRALSSVANAMLTLLERNPNETFLIEGHTDAVGSDISNLRLSDLRAATIARVLTDFYGVPPENLATQGYGERYLKIRTEAAERENRRVTIRRITPLITVANN